ncbi:MAG: hypothetical protein JRG90_20005, partial [Deltaproteobacteria bacterium]|nr:hypothetical protein [Deltaproteobacteria bacterium]
MRRARRIHGVGLLAALAIVCVAATAQAQPGITLEAGDIIVLNVEFNNGSVDHIDPDTGVRTTLANGTAVKSPRGVAFSPEGLIYVADTFNDWVVRINPDSGETIFVQWIDAIGIPDPAAMIADEASGWDLLLVEADDPRILRIDPATGLISTEHSLVGTRFPIGLTRDPTDGTLIVADRFTDDPDEFAGVHRVDVASGLQTAVSLKPEYESLRRVGVQSNGDIIVSDHDNATVWYIKKTICENKICIQGLVGEACTEAAEDIDCFDPDSGICEINICIAGLVGEACTEDIDCFDPDPEPVFEAPVPFGTCSFNGPNGIAVDTNDSVLVTD